MRKVTTILLVVFLLLAIVACKKTPETDMYGHALVEEDAETMEDPETDPSQGTSESIEAVLESEEEDSVTTNKTEELETTVSEDVYDSEESTVEEVDASTVEVVEPTRLDDPDFQASLLKYFDPIYYNLLFRLGDYEEGITEEDMIKFAISYIYQNEYNEIKFDESNFILYASEQRVEELVLRYFDFEVTGHHSFIDDNIMYQDGYYLVPAVDTKQELTMRIVAMTATGDFSYDVIMPMPEVDEDENAYYRASIEVRDDRYILTGYLKQSKEEAQVSEEEMIELELEESVDALDENSETTTE